MLPVPKACACWAVSAPVIATYRCVSIGVPIDEQVSIGVQVSDSVPTDVRLHVFVPDDYTPAVSAVHRCRFGGFETLPLCLAVQVRDLGMCWLQNNNYLCHETMPCHVPLPNSRQLCSAV